MAYGLEIRDASGAVTLNSDTKVGRTLGITTIGFNGSGYFDVTARVSGETVFAVLTVSNIEGASHELYLANSGTGAPDVNGNRVVYSLSGASGHIVYGVY